jgi:four helix bundle protein
MEIPNGGVRSFKDLIAWQKAFELAVRLHRSTGEFPRDERYGLASEIRKTARSIAYNIAEGHQRHTTKEYVRFLDIALGSQAELETQILFAGRLGLLDRESGIDLCRRCREVGKIVRGLSTSLLARSSADPRDHPTGRVPSGHASD